MKQCCVCQSDFEPYRTVHVCCSPACAKQKWASENPEKVLECARRAGKKWRESHPDKARDKDRKWKEEHREEVREAARLRARRRRAEAPEESRKQAKEYTMKNPGVGKKSALKRKYGMTLEGFDEMMLNQGGMCAICTSESRLCVDHNHDTQKVRALICDSCNVGLGRFKDSAELVQAAADYLRRHS